jgi:hypothetical protein
MVSNVRGSFEECNSFLPEPELFWFTEGIIGFYQIFLYGDIGTVNDNDELATLANMLLVRMCGVTPPQPMVNPILDAIFEAIQTSPVCLSFSVNAIYECFAGQSWRLRLKALPLVQGMPLRQHSGSFC